MTKSMFWLRLVFGLLFFVLANVALFLMYSRSFSVSLSGIPGNEQERGIQVTGKGVVEAIPDVARFTTTVRSEGENVSDIQSDSSQKINSVISFLKGRGIAEKDIKTQSFDISPQYRYENGRQIQEGFEATQSVLVTVRNLDLAGDILSGVSNLTVDSVGSLYFEVDNEDELSDQAKELAIKDARDRAERLVSVSGARIGGVISIQEETVSIPSPLARLETALDAGSSEITSPQIEPGSQEIIQNISVTFEIIN